MARFDSKDFGWSVIEPLLPTDWRGKERVDDRSVVNGIFWWRASVSEHRSDGG